MDGLNWICIGLDLSRFRGPSAYRRAAEECLAELRALGIRLGIGDSDLVH